MYDILELKSKLLPALQDIAKNLNVPKYRSLKKMDLIYQILDVQAINPSATKEKKINSNTSQSKSATKPNQNIKPSKSMEAISQSKENSSTSKNEKIGHNETLKPKERVMRPRRKNETQLDRIKKAEERDSETKEQNQPKKAVDTNDTVQKNRHQEKHQKVNDNQQRNRQNHQRNQHNRRNENKPSVEFEFEGIITSAVSYTHLTLPTNREV